MMGDKGDMGDIGPTVKGSMGLKGFKASQNLEINSTLSVKFLNLPVPYSPAMLCVHFT